MPKCRLLISLVTKDNDYQREQAAAAEETAKALGVETRILYADSDAITQSQQLLEVIQSPRASEYNGIIVEPCGGTSMTQVAREAIKRLVPGCASRWRKKKFSICARVKMI